MSKMIIVEGNSNYKDNTRNYFVKGERGYSAYELYVQNGGTLTEEEWLNEFLNADNFYNKSETDDLLDDKINITDIVDNVNSTATNKPLSANQGKELKDLVDGKADSSTTLDGYGITDAYTKSEIDTELSNYKINGDFAVITGTIECATQQGYNSKNIDYPTGFTQNNCVVISFGSGGQSFNFGYAGLAFGYNYTSANNGYLTGAQDRNIIFYENNMGISYYNSSSATVTYAYQIVLMKIS